MTDQKKETSAPSHVNTNTAAARKGRKAGLAYRRELDLVGAYMRGGPPSPPYNGAELAAEWQAGFDFAFKVASSHNKGDNSK